MQKGRIDASPMCPFYSSPYSLVPIPSITTTSRDRLHHRGRLCRRCGLPSRRVLFRRDRRRCDRSCLYRHQFCRRPASRDHCRPVFRRSNRRACRRYRTWQPSRPYRRCLTFQLSRPCRRCLTFQLSRPCRRCLTCRPSRPCRRCPTFRPSRPYPRCPTCQLSYPFRRCPTCQPSRSCRRRKERLAWRVWQVGQRR